MAALRIILIFTSTLIILASCAEKHTNKSAPNIDIQTDTTSRLFLLSIGLTTDTLKNEFMKMVGDDVKTLSTAIVVNASSTEKKKQKKYNKIKVQFGTLGFDTAQVAMFDLMKTAPSALFDFDIIYILGGNPFLLLDDVNKSGAKSVFIELANQGKFLMGYSAGAMILGPDLTLMNSVDSLLGFNEIDLQEFSCIGLYDFHIFPHYEDFTSQVPELAQHIDSFESQSNLPVHRFNDNQGLIYADGSTRLIGK